MRIEAYRCDMCGTETGSVRNVEFPTGESQMDPSGNGYQHEVASLDFCIACERKALREYAAAHPEKWRKKA